MLNEILKKFGATDEQIATLTKEGATIEQFNELLYDPRLKEIREAAKNDPEYHAQLKKEANSSVYKNAQRKISKHFGLTAEETKDFETIDEFLNLGTSRINEGKDATNQELQDKYLSVKNEFEAFKTDEVPRIKEEAQAKINEFQFNTHISEWLANQNGSIIFQPNVSKTLIQAELKASYQRKFGENGLEILTKDGLKPTKDDKPLSIDEVYMDIIDRNGGIKKSNGNGGTPAPNGKPVPDVNVTELGANAARMLAAAK